MGNTGIFAGIWYAFGTVGAAGKTMAGCGPRLNHLLHRYCKVTSISFSRSVGMQTRFSVNHNY
jgi:hypothetical protein